MVVLFENKQSQRATSNPNNEQEQQATRPTHTHNTHLQLREKYGSFVDDALAIAARTETLSPEVGTL